jgi:hypothetical protein
VINAQDEKNIRPSNLMSKGYGVSNPGETLIDEWCYVADEWTVPKYTKVQM